MKMELTSQQAEMKEEFETFFGENLAPVAGQYDREEWIPKTKIEEIAARGYLGANIDEKNGGRGWDSITTGLLFESVGMASCSLLSILTVHGMVGQALQKWGDTEQQSFLLPKLADGSILGAFALSEPNIGSDAKNIETVASQSNDKTFVLNGKKKWISFGQMADLFIIITQCEGKPTAFLVEKERPGFAIKPIKGMSGFKSAMLAELNLINVEIPESNLIGRIGSGFTHVAGTALDFGRYSIAWGAIGLAQACMEASLNYSSSRKQGGRYLKDHQLIQEMVAEMITGIKAARLLCLETGYLKDTGDPDSIMNAAMAKYFASQISFRSAKDAVQIHGANGCCEDYPVARYLRDAKIIEIIEGSNQIQQTIIAKYGYQGY
jgi:hypothetical protein